jgi:hypothetical protein
MTTTAPQRSARLSLTSMTTLTGQSDGAWWPYASGRCDLLMVPPDAEPASAARLMAAASVPGDLHTAALLVSEGPARSPCLRTCGSEAADSGTPSCASIIRVGISASAG